MKTTLYRKSVFRATIVLAALTFTLQGWAQYRSQPKNNGPRALAVLEVGAKGGARLIPVSLWYEGQYYDATFYQANPVPLSLYADTLYEALKAGSQAGRFTVHGARQLGNTWWGDGYWKPLLETGESKPAVAPTSTATFSDTGKPILQTPETTAAKEPTLKQPSTASSGQQKESGPDEIRVKIDKNTGRVSDTTPEQPPAGQSGNDKEAKKDTPPPDTDDSGRPHLHRASVPPADSVGSNEQIEEDDPNRPRLTRSEPGDRNRAEEADKIIGPRTYIVAVSDRHAMEYRPLDFAWTDSEEATLTADAQKAAIAALRKAAPFRHFKIPAKGDVPLSDVAVRAYDLDYSNSPEVVYTATYVPPAEAEAKKQTNQTVKAGVWLEGNTAEKLAEAAAGAPLQTLQKSYSVTVVLRQSADGVVSTIFTEVSDPLDLQTFPALRLVDAVDANGDGRPDLLFRNITPQGTGFVLYRVTPYEMTRVFDTPPRRY